MSPLLKPHCSEHGDPLLCAPLHEERMNHEAREEYQRMVAAGEWDDDR